MLLRICSAADGACARIPAAHAGAGFRFGVAGIALAGAGVGFVSIGRPIVPVVIQRVRFLIGGVIAAGAGIVGAPALFRAGGAFTSSWRCRSWLFGSISPLSKVLGVW